MRRFAYKYPLSGTQRKRVEVLFGTQKLKELEELIDKSTTYDDLWNGLTSDIDLKQLLQKDMEGATNSVELTSYSDEKGNEVAGIKKLTFIENDIYIPAHYYEDIKNLIRYTLHCFDSYDKKITLEMYTKGLSAIGEKKYRLPIYVNGRKREFSEFCQYYQYMLLYNGEVPLGPFKIKKDNKYYKEFSIQAIEKTLFEQTFDIQPDITKDDIWLIEHTFGVNLAISLFPLFCSERRKIKLDKLKPLIKQLIRLDGMIFRVTVSEKLVREMLIEEQNRAFELAYAAEKIATIYGADGTTLYIDKAQLKSAQLATGQGEDNVLPEDKKESKLKHRYEGADDRDEELFEELKIIATKQRRLFSLLMEGMLYLLTDTHIGRNSFNKQENLALKTELYFCSDMSRGIVRRFCVEEDFAESNSMKPSTMYAILQKYIIEELLDRYSGEIK